MPYRHAVLFVLLLALCGCDRLGKGFGPQPKMLPPPKPVGPASPPVAAPRVETIDEHVEKVVAAPSVENTADEAAHPTQAPTEPSLLLYEDSFSDVAGSIRRKIDGKQQPSEGPPASRTVYTFQATPEEGTLTLRIFEDNTTAGPDGEPGVLALAWDELPKKLAWSGFPYLGGAQAGKRMMLPKLQAARTVDDLRGLRLRFKYRGVNPSRESPVQIQVNCRLEPVLDDSYKHRVEFGTLLATDQWQSFDLSLADGTNLDAFLKMLANSNPPSFKIVWGQSVPIEKYSAGDTLQIDDISVTTVPRAAAAE